MSDNTTLLSNLKSDCKVQIFESIQFNFELQLDDYPQSGFFILNEILNLNLILLWMSILDLHKYWRAGNTYISL